MINVMRYGSCSRWRVGSIATGVVAVAILAVAGVAHASGRAEGRHTDGGEAPVAVASSAAPAHEAVGGLPAITSRIAALGGDSFAGSDVAAAAGRIVAHWVGSTPQVVLDYVATLPPGVHVENVEGAQYGRTQLQAIATRIADSTEADAAGVGSIAVKSDGSGLRVDLVADLPADDERAALVSLSGLPASALEFAPDTGEIVPLAAPIED